MHVFFLREVWVRAENAMAESLHGDSPRPMGEQALHVLSDGHAIAGCRQPMSPRRFPLGEEGMAPEPACRQPDVRPWRFGFVTTIGNYQDWTTSFRKLPRFQKSGKCEASTSCWLRSKSLLGIIWTEKHSWQLSGSASSWKLWRLKHLLKNRKIENLPVGKC